jgi:hypothetical protein
MKGAFAMRRFSLLGLGLLAVLVSAAAMATSAFSVQPSNLPEGAKQFSGAHEGTTVFHNSTAGDIVCKTVSSLEGTENEETSNLPPLGPFHWHFKECGAEATGSTCTGLGETTAGTILVLGTWHLMFDRPRGGTFTGLTTAVLFLLNPVAVFHCTALVLVELKGELLCLHLKAEEANKVHSYHCGGTGTTPDDEWCKGGDVAGTCVEPTLPSLLGSVNKAAFTTSLILALGNTNYLVAVTGMV